MLAEQAQQQDKVSRTVFVGGLSWNVDKDWLEDELLKALDVTEGINEVRVARDAMGKSKGCVASLSLSLSPLSLSPRRFYSSSRLPT